MDSIHKAYNKIIHDTESLSEGFLTDIKTKLTGSNSTNPKKEITISIDDLHNSADHLTPEHLHKILDSPHPNFREAAMYHNKIDASHISRALTDPHPGVRSAAMDQNRHKLTAGHISTALQDPYAGIRRRAIDHNLCTNAQKAHAYTTDPDPNIRAAALKTRY